MKPRIAAVLLVACTPVGCVTVVQRTSPLGRPVQIQTNVEREAAAGELLAVDEQALLLRGPHGPRKLAMAEIEKVRINRTSLTRGVGYRWTIIGALVTGAGLAASCASVSEDSCVGVGAVTAAVWLLFGGPAASTMDASSFSTLHKPSVDQLRPFARFPQGLPPGFAVGLPRTEQPAEAVEPRKAPDLSKPE